MALYKREGVVISAQLVTKDHQPLAHSSQPSLTGWGGESERRKEKKTWNLVG